MNAKDYIADEMNNKMRNLSTVTVNAVQSTNDITDFSIFNALNAITGSWGSSRSYDTQIAYIGKVCFWRKIGSGTMTFSIPPNNLDNYFAELLNNTSAKGILINKGLSQLTVSMSENEAWQVTGIFTIVSKD